MKKYLSAKIIVPLALLAGSQLAFANTTVTLGDQDYADGAKDSVGNFQIAGALEPAPFGLFIGADSDTGPNFSANWSFSYGAIADTITGGSLILGIYDHESAASGNQVASFTVNGVDLTGALNTLFESHGGTSREDNVYTLTLPSSTFAGLASGTVNVSLSLQGPGLGLFDPTKFNGAGLDFSTLNVVTTIPEPLSSTLLLLGVPAVFAAARRKMA